MGATTGRNASGRRLGVPIRFPGCGRFGFIGKTLPGGKRTLPRPTHGLHGSTCIDALREIRNRRFSGILGSDGRRIASARKEPYSPSDRGTDRRANDNVDGFFHTDVFERIIPEGFFSRNVPGNISKGIIHRENGSGKRKVSIPPRLVSVRSVQSGIARNGLK